MKPKKVGLTLPTACEGFMQFKMAEGLSKRTMTSYRQHLDVWLEYMNAGTIDTDIAQVTTPQLRAFMSYMLNEFKPRRIIGENLERLSPKTVRNWWATLAALFHWASDEFQIPNVMKGVPAPKITDKPVEPFTKEEIEKILKACDFTEEADTDRRKKFTMRRATGYRDRAIVMMLLDTGRRAGELCALRSGDLDEKTGKVLVRHGYGGGSKGKKGRIVYLGKTARKTVWRYLATREDGKDPDAPLFIGRVGRPLNQNSLAQVIHALGEKAGVPKTYPHRFRHTFAITFLRAGGDLFTLQSLLGHSTLEVVRIYARVADIDVEQAHRKASPADNWRL